MMSNANLSSLDSRNVRRTRRVCAFTALLPCGLGDVVEVAMEVANENSLSVIEQVVDQFGGREVVVPLEVRKRRAKSSTCVE